MLALFIDLGILNFIVELARLESPVMFIGFLSVAFFSGVITGLLLMVTYQAKSINKFMGIALKPDSPLLRLLEKADSLSGSSPMGPDGKLDQNMIQGLVGSVFGALGGGPMPTDRTDDLGLSRRRRTGAHRANKQKTDK